MSVEKQKPWSGSGAVVPDSVSVPTLHTEGFMFSHTLLSGFPVLEKICSESFEFFYLKSFWWVFKVLL